MVDRQSLIPDNLPYGERRRLVQSRQSADLPVSAAGSQGTSAAPTRQTGVPSSAPSSLPAPRSGSAMGGFNALTETTPDQYPGVIGGGQMLSADPINRPPATVREGLVRASQTARSAFVREVGRRLAEKER